MTRSEPFKDYQRKPSSLGQMTAPSVMSSGLTVKKCRDMQRVVLHTLMEKSHDPAGAREVLESLGLACKFPDEEDEAHSYEVRLLWSRTEMIV
jgi:hypothetical protein